MEKRGDGDFFFLYWEVDEFPCGTVLQESRDQSGVHSVAGSLGHYVALDAFARQRQVADQVENFMADKFVGKTERAILYALAGQDDCIFF